MNNDFKLLIDLSSMYIIARTITSIKILVNIF